MINYLPTDSRYREAFRYACPLGILDARELMQRTLYLKRKFTLFSVRCSSLAFPQRTSVGN